MASGDHAVRLACGLSHKCDGSYVLRAVTRSAWLPVPGWPDNENYPPLAVGCQAHGQTIFFGLVRGMIRLPKAAMGR